MNPSAFAFEIDLFIREIMHWTEGAGLVVLGYCVL